MKVCKMETTINGDVSNLKKTIQEVVNLYDSGEFDNDDAEYEWNRIMRNYEGYDEVEQGEDIINDYDWGGLFEG